MTDALEILWHLFDSPSLLLGHDEVTRWPLPTVAKLTHLAFLREAVSVDYAACPNCPDRHVEEVLCRSDPNGQTRFYIPCPENLRVEIAADNLRRWTFDVDAVARRLASAIAPGGRCTQRTALPVSCWKGLRQKSGLSLGAR